MKKKVKTILNNSTQLVFINSNPSSCEGDWSHARLRPFSPAPQPFELLVIWTIRQHYVGGSSIHCGYKTVRVIWQSRGAKFWDHPRLWLLTTVRHIMTSSYGNIFRVTIPFCGCSSVIGGFPSQRDGNADFWYFFVISLNKQMNKHWFETSWRSVDVAVISDNYDGDRSNNVIIMSAITDSNFLYVRLIMHGTQKRTWLACALRLTTRNLVSTERNSKSASIVWVLHTYHGQSYDWPRQIIYSRLLFEMIWCILMFALNLLFNTSRSEQNDQHFTDGIWQ